MKLLLLISLLVFSKAIAQNKDSIYRLESIPVYDQDGNMMAYAQKYDHVPTPEDTASFLLKGHGIITREWKEQSQKIFDDIMKEYDQKYPPDSSKIRKSAATKSKKKA